MHPFARHNLAASSLAILLATVAPAAFAQTGGTSAEPAAAGPDAKAAEAATVADPSVEIAGLDKEIAEAEADLAAVEGGLIGTLVQARLETLKLTRAILENHAAAAKGGATTEITVPVAAPDPARADEILKGIEAQMKVIAEAEAEAAGAGGLIAAIAVSRVQTEKLTLASLRAAWMTATYGSIVPVDVQPVAAAPSAAANPDAPAASVVEPKANSLPEWVDPAYPDVDYTRQSFSQLHAEGFKIHGWWGLRESRAEVDDSPMVVALNVSQFKDGYSMTNPGLNIACREGEVAVVYDTDTFIMGDFQTDSLQTTYRIDDQPAQTEAWSKITSNEGSGLFGARGEAMLRRLYDAEKLFLRISDRATHDATFPLDGIQPVIDSVSRACSFSLLELSKDDYRAIQTMLNAAGFDAGTPDGVWGSGSADAMRKWQEQNGVEPTGAPNRTTLEAMGLDVQG